MCDFEFETREILIACVGDGWRKVEARVCGDFAYPGSGGVSQWTMCRPAGLLAELGC